VPTLRVPDRVGDLGLYLREQREQAKLSLRELAKAAGVSTPYLSQIERGLRKPSADILQQIAKALSISAETLYVRAGILDASSQPPSGVVEAIRADLDLDEDQKTSLVQIYESFRATSATVAHEQSADPDPIEATQSPETDGVNSVDARNRRPASKVV